MQAELATSFAILKVRQLFLAPKWSACGNAATNSVFALDNDY